MSTVRSLKSEVNQILLTSCFKFQATNRRLLFVLLLISFISHSQSTDENYVVGKTYKKATTIPVTENDKDSVMTTVQYFDGLGRLKQTIAVQAGGFFNNEIKDIVTHTTYDEFGRQAKEYLPFTNGANDCLLYTSPSPRDA